MVTPFVINVDGDWLCSVRRGQGRPRSIEASVSAADIELDNHEAVEFLVLAGRRARHWPRRQAQACRPSTANVQSRTFSTNVMALSGSPGWLVVEQPAPPPSGRGAAAPTSASRPSGVTTGFEPQTATRPGLARQCVRRVADLADADVLQTGLPHADILAGPPLQVSSPHLALDATGASRRSSRSIAKSIALQYAGGEHRHKVDRHPRSSRAAAGSSAASPMSCTYVRNSTGLPSGRLP
jgi:hypothetical protein